MANAVNFGGFLRRRQERTKIETRRHLRFSNFGISTSVPFSKPTEMSRKRALSSSEAGDEFFRSGLRK
jgi:hypothetical protein